MSKNIFFKLFIITAIFISAFISIMVLLQSTFFEKYYIMKKTDTVQENLRILISEYEESSDYTSSEIMKETEKFSQLYNSKVFYVDIDDWSVSNSSISSSISVSGIISGRPESDDNMELFIREIDNWKEIYKQNKTALNTGKIISYNIQDFYQNINIVSISAVVSSGKAKGILYVFTSLQPVGEAAAVIRDYYVLFFLGTIILIIILSLVFSKIISKPLVDINRVASKIAEMDFSERCKWRSKDELGNLSNTINILSDNLNAAIHELKASNSRLEDELEKQKELENMRKDFIAGVSHELKTPISIIKGYSEGILDSMEKGIIKEDYIAVIVDEAKKMNILVNDMLDLSQLESGKAEINMEPFLICRLANFVLKKFIPNMAQKNITTSVNFDNRDLSVCGDSFKIEQVIMNLLSNAFRYTPQGGEIRIIINEFQDKAQVKIENSGSRLEEDDLEKIWEKFYRVDKSRNKTLGGNGLGLSIVKNILELHKSSFGVRNTDNGVEFYFFIDKYVENRPA